MDITIINMVVGLLLVAAPLYVFYRFKTNLIRSSIVSLARR